MKAKIKSDGLLPLGTGKSTTVAALVEQLTLVDEQRVLLTSHTHSAVDTVLLKLVDAG